MSGGGWTTGKRDAITDVPGIRVGHWTDRRAATGCTVVLCETSTAVAADVRGGAPGTREIDVLAQANVVRRCDAVLLSGGSAFGLAAATGVVRWCAEREIGFATTAGRVPIVSGAVIFDLGVGKPAFPGDAEGYAAAAAAKAGAVGQGSVGAGTGATVGKLLGAEVCVKGGIGTASVAGPKGLVVGALVVTNAVGHIFDPATGELVAGPREASGGFVPLAEALARRQAKMEALVAENTTLVCVATNAALEHHAMQRIAYQAHDGLARTIVPCHTLADGDVAFAISMGQVEATAGDSLIVGAMTVQAVERAVLKSVRLARGLAGAAAVGGPRALPGDAEGRF
ncbi:MAG: P1 family peptidase [Dehalococcoidia bacterium]